MPALVHHALRAGGVELREVPVPEAGPGEVLLRVRGVSVFPGYRDAPQLTAQAPLLQTWPVGQAVPHAPQLAGS